MRRIVHVLSFLACLALLGDAHAAGITSSPTPVKGVPVVTPISTTSTAAVALYVDGALGNDGNACIASGASACLTIQGAIDKIPLFGSGTTTINIAAGTYTENPKIESKNPYQWLPLSAASSFIIVQGATPTVAVGVADRLVRGPRPRHRFDRRHAHRQLRDGVVRRSVGRLLRAGRERHRRGHDVRDLGQHRDAARIRVRFDEPVRRGERCIRSSRRARSSAGR
jgi:hypothetical protein